MVFERNKRNDDLEEKLVSLKQQLLQHVKFNKSLKAESEKLKADNNALEESYLEELVVRNKIKDLHKSALGHRNPMYLKSAQLCCPVLYLGDVNVDPVHTPFRVYDSEETLVQAEVSRTNMLNRMKDPLCKMSSKPINYAKLNSLYDTFVPQKQLSSKQVYWLPANEVVSYNCNQSKPITTFVRTRPTKSQVYTQLKMLKACFPEFEKTKIFDELDKEYDQRVIDKKSLEIENKNLLIQNECLLVESVSKDICSVVLTFDIAVPMNVKPRFNCIKEHSKNLELEAEILKMKQLLIEKEKRTVSTSEPANNVIGTPMFSKKPLTSYKRKDRKLKDISTGSSPNTETKVVNDPMNVNDLSANQLDPNKNWVSDVPNSTAL
ncbi:hypothetical protein Tco_0400881 [Tanacetum coccineum]